MKISEIDKNLEVDTKISKDDIVWLDVTNEPFVIYGAASLSPFKRMPDEVSVNVNEGVHALKNNTAGIRARFKTNSPYIAIHAEWNSQCVMPHMPICGISGFDIYEYSNGRQKYLSTFIPLVSSKNGYESVKEFGGEMKEYILNFPLYNSVTKLYIGVKNDSQFEKTSNYSIDKPVVYYGSSITQGGCASRPGNCYQNFISRALDIDYINLGFSGNAKGETTMAEYIANLEMSAFVLDYDHNAPTVEHLANTHYNFYKIIREKNPELPIVMLSRPDYNVGNTVDDGRRSVVMESFVKAKKDGDRNVYFVDGASLFAGDEWFACTVDGTHPNDLGFYRFAQALIPTFETIFK